MRFGMFVPQGWRHDLVNIDPSEQWETMRSIAQHADEGPWDSIWVYDHFHTVPVPSEQATHEAWTLMAAFAASTSRVKLGQMCTCASYRPAAYLAKVASTVDIISGGRAQMGIGAGWYEHEWRAYGYGFPRPGERLARLRETVEVFRQAWTTGTATLHGEHLDVDGAIVRPLPLQQGGIPMWIAGGGEKVTLRITAEYASYANFGGGNPETFAAKAQILRAHCADIGRDPAEIVLSDDFNVVIGQTQADAAARVDAIEARVAPFLGPSKTAEFIAPYRNGAAFVGTPDELIERFRIHQEAGLGYAITYWPEAAYDRSGLELFEREVIPALT